MGRVREQRARTEIVVLLFLVTVSEGTSIVRYPTFLLDWPLVVKQSVEKFTCESRKRSSLDVDEKCVFLPHDRLKAALGPPLG